MTAENLRFPRNLQAMGIIAGPEHVSKAGELIRMTPCVTAARLLSLWRRSIETHPFIVIAGALYREKGGISGGLAPDLDNAALLYMMCHKRLDAMAENHGDFTSMWFLLLTDEQQARIEAEMAREQETTGSA